ncbi:MAG TPA: hypothetical protein VJX71_16230 [Methylomirabilota bacterium]|jgi:hypothetical protein|nr:hypothetical protein [Methylomirabilota bacterium]
MTPRRMALAAVLVLTVVFLSPIAYLAGQRAGVWLTTPAEDRSGPWPSVDEGERDSSAPAERSKPAVRPGFGEI